VRCFAFQLCLTAALLVALPAPSFAADAVAEPPAKATATEFPPELVKFTPYDQNPVFIAAPGQWDAKMRERGWILHEGNEWRMWYTGYDGGRESKRSLGYATSPDGLNWTRDPRNPVYSDITIEDMQVLRHDGRYYMFAEQDNSSQWFTSPDGVKWTREGTLDIRLTSGKPISEGPFGTPTVWIEDGTWYLMYERGDQAIWLASSKDPKTWTNVQDEPVLRPGPGEYDSVMIAVNQVIRYNGRYYAYYHGSGDKLAPRKWSSNIATSTDRIHWTKYSGNPIVAGDRSSDIVVPIEFPKPANGDGAAATSDTQFSFTVPMKFRLYTMHDRVDAFLPAQR
jgi:sucrose-6-phosphate hydrolase SacC (GH32 family)